MGQPATLYAVVIFAGTYLVLAIGRLPGFRVDRTGAAIIGAALMIALNVLTISDAVAAINTDTIILLFGMMIVVANLRLSRHPSRSVFCCSPTLDMWLTEVIPASLT